MIRALTYRLLSRFKFLVAASLLFNFTGIAVAQSLETSAKETVLASSVVKIGQSNCKVVLHVLPKATSTEVYEAHAKLICRGQVLSSVQFRPIDTPAFEHGSYQYTISGKIMEDTGLSGGVKLIKFHFEYPACDYECGDIILILRKVKLSYGLTASTSSNEQCDSGFHYIFPKDINGVPNKLKIIYTFKDPETKYKSSEDQIESYSWNGERFKHIAGQRPIL